MIGKEISHYRIVELIGGGGMGDVYRAEDLSLDRTVAIKAIKPSERGSPEAERQFLNEARTVSRIDHPNVVMLIEVLEQEGTHYIVMPMLEGETLQCRISKGPLSLLEAIDIASQVAAGLDAAHRHGVIHRDLKPDNVMCSPTGVCKILDFGVARLIDRSTRSEPGHVVGTLRYMAPEQFQSSTVDARADVYGLGTVLFEMVAGRPPFAADDPRVLMHDIMNTPPPSLRSLRPETPPSLERVIGRALAKSPDQRYASAAELLHDLKVVRSELVTTSEAGGLLPSPRTRWTPRRLAGVAALLVVLVAGVYLMASRQPPRVIVVRWENQTGRAELQSLEGRIMDGLIRALGWREGLDVVSRQTVAATVEALEPQAAGLASFQADFGALGRAARRVGATYMVSGSIEPAGGLIRLNCELTDLRRGVVVRGWTRDVVDPDNDYYGAIEAFAADIATTIGARGRAHARTDRSMAQLLTPSIDALTAYQKALEESEVGNLPAACADLRQALALDSTFVDAHRLLAGLTPEFEEARRHYAAAMRLRAGAAPVTRLLVEADDLFFRKQWDAAIDTYQKVLALDPEEVTARKQIAVSHRRRRRFSDAAAEFATLHQINPYDYSYYTEWGYTYVEIARDDRAFGILRNWHRQFPLQVAPIQALIRFHIDRGQYEAAAALCDTLDVLKPGGAGAFRGILFATRGRLRDAETHFRELQRSPDPFHASTRGGSYLAYLYSMEQRYSDGLSLIDTVLRVQPETYNFWIGGVLAARSGDTLRAERYARDIAGGLSPVKAETASPEAFGLWRFYFHLQGLIAAAEKRPDIAVQYFEQSVSYSSRQDSPMFRTELGHALLEAGRPERAVQELRQVLEVNPRYPEALLYLGRAYLLEGRKAEARSVLEQLKTLWKEADADYPLNIELSRLMAAARAG